MDNHQLGQKGEAIAADFLLDRGYQIIESNFWSKYGEIDLIARQEETLVFVEVKTASKQSRIKPQEQITYYKQRHLARVARYYLLNRKLDSNCRFDLVAISGWRTEEPEIELIKNAFLVD